MEDIKLSPEIIKAIEKILAKGNTAEIKKRKNDIIVLDVSRHIEESMPLNGEGKK